MERNQVVAEKYPEGIPPFIRTLSREGVSLLRGETTILQLNIGLRCNQRCLHCHLGAGPDREELMGQETIDEVVAYAERSRFEIIDITGGAPELNPRLIQITERLSPFCSRLMLRSNLTALLEVERKKLLEEAARHSVVIIASLPSTNAGQVDAQRGRGAMERSITILRELNALGYGQDGSGLTLDLVSNPSGAFLLSSQETTEKKFKIDLKRKWGIFFNHLFNFTNVPLGRFRSWLRESSNYESYMKMLASKFNPCTINGLGCRITVSIDWEGFLYDCDFNLAIKLPLGGVKTHVSEMKGPPEAGSRIALSDHCYACTAGAGFT